MHQGVKESDDVILLEEEISKATNYLTKSQLLLDKMNLKRQEVPEKKKILKMLPPPPPSNTKAIMPRPNTASDARIKMIRPKVCMLCMAMLLSVLSK